MSDIKNKAGSAPENPMAVKKDVKFRQVRENGKDHYQVELPLIHLTWIQGAKTEIHFVYPGKKGLMLIPYPNIFEPIDGSDQVFELKKNKVNKLTLRDETVVDKYHPVDGSLEFSYAIYDEHFKTFAIGNSPPNMVLGP